MPLPVSFNIRHIFRTRISSQYSYSDYFVQNYEGWETRKCSHQFLLPFWKNWYVALQKRKNNNGDQNAAESMQN